MTYKDLLLENDWQLKCNEILNRDHYICQDCGSLGFHNGGNFISLYCVSEIDSLLKDWRFNGLSFSEFIGKSPISKTRTITVHPKEETKVPGGQGIYCLLFQKPYSVFDYGSKAICDYSLSSTIDAEFYKGNIISNIKHDVGGRVMCFEFSQQLSAAINMNIEHLLIGYIDGLRYDVTILNITFKNKVISIRLSPYGCGIKGLNVHHRYYTIGSKPWEYSNDALVTLCQDCHSKRHKDAKVPLYTPEHQLIKHLIPCSRCGGSGYLPQYNHVENGICFKCGGEGVILDD